MFLGYGIRAARKRAGLTQQQLSDAVGVTMEYVSMLENGRRECSISLLHRLSQVCGVPVPIIVYLSMTEDDAPMHHKDDYRVLKPKADSILGYIFDIDV